MNTKNRGIVCTLGPASWNYIKELKEAGMDIARINGSFGIPYKGAIRELIEYGIPILVDLPGTRLKQKLSYITDEDLINYSIENKVTDETDNEKQHPWRFTDESLISFLPSSLGYTQPITNTFATVAPNNLYDSFFLSLYAQGVFDKESDDLQNLATCLLHEIDTEVEIKKIWPRYSKLRYNKLKKVIWSKVTKKMPWWAKRFNKIWNILSDPQIDALTLEWFHDSDIKPSQLDNANQLGISIAAYQERLHWAYKKIEDLYPEFKRIKRRKTESLLKKRSPAPLYLIDINGEKIEIPTTAKREKKLTARQIIQIRKRAREVTKDKFVLMEDDEK